MNLESIEVGDYQSEKQAREKRLVKYAESVQKMTLSTSAEIIYVLVEERKRQNISQSELAGMIGIQPSNLARFESGVRVPTLVMLQKYAIALGKHIELKIYSNEE